MANRLRYMVKKLKAVSPETLELAFTHAVETGIYEKSAFLNCVKAFATKRRRKRKLLKTASAYALWKNSSPSLEITQFNKLKR